MKRTERLDSPVNPDYLTSTMKSKFLSALFLICFLGTFACVAGDKLEITMSEEIVVGKPGSNLYQSDLRCNPSKPLEFCITAKQNNSEKETILFHTADGGATWNMLQQPASGDPDVAYDLSGTAHWSFIDKSASNKLGYRRSKDGGATWEDKKSLSVAVDHPHIVCDRNEKSPFKGSIYVAGRPFSGGGLGLERSRDGGANFKSLSIPLAGYEVATPELKPGISIWKPTGIGKLQTGFVFAPVILSDGTLLIPMMTSHTMLADAKGGYAGSLKDIYCLRSTDGGETFGNPVKIASKNSIGNDAGAGDASCLGGFAAGKWGKGQRVYLTYSQSRPGKPADLMLTTSDDAGMNWSKPRAIVPSTPSGWGAGSSSVMVNADGVVGVQYYSMKEGNNEFDIYFTASADGGNTFTAPARVSKETSTEPKNPRQPRTPGQDQVYGDVASDGSFRIVWPDARNKATFYSLYSRMVKVHIKQ